jgi:hypothetical protein
VTGEHRAFGRTLLLAVDQLFLGSLLFIHWDVRRAAPAWPDAGGLGGAELAFAAAAAAVLAALLCRTRLPPLAPFFALAAAVLFAALALRAAGARGVGFGVGRYGTLLFAFTWIWIGHLLGAMIALGRRASRGEPPGIGRFVACVAIFGVVLSTWVFAG